MEPAPSRRPAGRRGGRLIVTDSVFSMDGDVAPLAEIVELANSYGARTVVDEAHATGALGPDGRGAIAEAGLEGEVDVVVGTLGKALGSYGAYVCADAEMVRYLINTARSLIFSTAPPPPAVAGALAALELLRERPHRVQRLRSNARALRRALAEEGFPVATDGMHIVPLIVGEERAAMRLCQERASSAACSPRRSARRRCRTGTSRLRLTAMASHTASELETAARVLGEVARAMGLDPAEIGPPLEERRPSELEPAVPYDEEPMPDAEPFIPAAPPSLADLEREAAAAELDAGRERLAAAVRARVRVPFDAEHASGRAEDPVADGLDGANAPFDIERETAVPRAA